MDLQGLLVLMIMKEIRVLFLLFVRPFVLNVVHGDGREEVGEVEETTLNKDVFEQYDLLINVSKLLDDLLKPNQTMNDPYVVSLVLSLLNAFDKRNETLVKIAKSEINITERNDRVVN